MWCGSDLLSGGRYLKADGCSFPPWVTSEKYTVFGMDLPMSLMNLMGCTVEADCKSKDKTTCPATLCVAYSGCGGQPTVALQMNSAVTGCVFGNDAMDMATDGLGEVAGEAMALTLSEVGFGLSLNGQFDKSVQVFTNEMSTTGVALTANAYFQTSMDVVFFVPDDIKDYIGFGSTASVVAVLQYGGGSVTEQVKKIFSADLEE